MKTGPGLNVQRETCKRLIGSSLEVFQYHNDPKDNANASEIIF